MKEILRRYWITCADPFAAALGSIETRIELQPTTTKVNPSETEKTNCSEAGSDSMARTYVETDGALLGVLVGGNVEAGREVAAADETAEASGVQVGELPEKELRPREPLLDRRPPP